MLEDRKEINVQNLEVLQLKIIKQIIQYIKTEFEEIKLVNKMKLLYFKIMIIKKILQDAKLKNKNIMIKLANFTFYGRSKIMKINHPFWLIIHLVLN